MGKRVRDMVTTLEISSVTVRSDDKSLRAEKKKKLLENCKKTKHELLVSL